MDPENIFVAIFAVVFGAFGAGQAASYGPDGTKGKKAGLKIFKITDSPSEINAMDEPNEKAISPP